MTLYLVEGLKQAYVIRASKPKMAQIMAAMDEPIHRVPMNAVELDPAKVIEAHAAHDEWSAKHATKH